MTQQLSPSAEAVDKPSPRGTRHRRKMAGWKKALIGLLVLVLLLVAAGVGGLLYLSHRLDHNIKRIPHVFSGLDPSTRPSVPAGAKGSQTFVLLGSDSRIDVTAQKANWSRSDTIMMLHLDKAHQHAYLVSIPRDSWVPIPGHGTAKVNAALAWGGPSLLVQTLEQLTDVHIDHLALIDFNGFKALVDALGGVDVTIPQTVNDPELHTTWNAGTQHLDGARALLYVRQRHGLPGGDFDRIKRQQNLLRSIMVKTLSSGTISNPITLTKTLDAISRSLSVDEDLTMSTMRSLAIGSRNMRSHDVTFLTVPLTGTGTAGGGQSVVFLDAAKDKALWTAMRDDRMAQWLKDTGTTGLGSSVR